MKNKIMKSPLKITSFVLVWFIISCTDINLAPHSQINEENFYKTSDDIESAIHGAYASLRSSGQYSSGLIRTGEQRSDNTATTWTGGAGFEIDSFYTFTMNSQNVFINTVWEDHYTGILRCNVVLDRIDSINMESSLKEQFKGEMRFLRALKYFNLVRIFGDIPLVITQISAIEANEMGRTPVGQVYEQIVEDLEYASEVLPISYSGSDIGRATSGAATGLLAKVHLTLHDFQNAKEKLEEVINSGVYDLLPDYGSLWDLSSPNSEESLFEVQYKKGGTGTGSNFATQFAPRFSTPYVVQIGEGTGFNSPTGDMEAAYEENDLRKDLSMQPGYTDGNGEFVPVRYVIKYHDIPTGSGGSDDNWPVLRYADILLMYAEVLNELGYVPDGTAFNYLNMIRNRAGLPDKTSSNVDPNLRISNQEEFRLAIEQERRVELAFENHRWFDLVRTGRALEVMNSKRNDFERPIPSEIQPHQLLFPIPQRVLDASPNIEQNPGY